MKFLLTSDSSGLSGFTAPMKESIRVWTHDGKLYSIMAQGRVFWSPRMPAGASDRRFVKVIGKGPQTRVCK